MSERTAAGEDLERPERTESLARGERPESPEGPESPASRERGALRWLVEVVAIVAVAFVLQAVVKAYLIQPFEIPSTSMENTLQVGDRVLVNKLAYRLGASPRYGDVVVFDEGGAGGTTVIKRVIALAGQTVDIRGGTVIVDGRALREPYVNADFPDTFDSDGTETIPPGTVWVMGDNRSNSQDSRYIGPVPIGSIEGRAFAIYWPLDRIRGLQGD